jgi:hypothetical protein
MRAPLSYMENPRRGGADFGKHSDRVRDIVLLFFRKDFPPIAKLVSELDVPSQH